MLALYSDDKVPSGKYKGMTVKEVYAINKEYVKRFNDLNTGRRGVSTFRANYFISDETILQLQNEEVTQRLSTRSKRPT